MNRKMVLSTIGFLAISMVLITIPTASAQLPDISDIMSLKFPIEIDGKTIVLKYGYHASMEATVEELLEPEPVVSSMNINTQRKSLEIVMEDVPLTNIFWVVLPEEVLYAEGEEYQLFVDGVETKYDLTKFPDGYALGMILPAGSKNIEIIGTYVIPEFGALVTIILAVAIIGSIYFARSKRNLSLPY